LSVHETLNLHPNKFWFLANQIDRLRSEALIEQIHALGSQGSSEAYNGALKTLSERVGQIYVWNEDLPTVVRVEDLGDGFDPAFDRDALNALKQRLRAEKAR